LALYGFDEQTGRLMVLSRHPGVSLDEIHANSRFEILVKGDVDQSPEPPEHELTLLREVIDPTGMAIGR
jgi:acyl CoA:acetate/3-ketoacid CoA transferase beta subunit